MFIDETEQSLNPKQSEPLKRAAVRGSFWSIWAQAGSFSCQLAVMPFMARLLTPDDYGLFAAASALTIFLAHFRDPGLASATIHSKYITSQQLSNLFWLNVGLSIVLSCVVAVLSPVLVWIYGDARLLDLTVVMGSTFLISGVGLQLRALLRRQMRLHLTPVIDLIANLFAFPCGLFVAWRHGGYWALVATALVFEVVVLVGLLSVTTWRPVKPSRGVGMRQFLVFGMPVLGVQILGGLTQRLDKILIGLHWGTATLGFYEKSFQILLLPQQQVGVPLGQLVHPTLSRLRDEPERYRRYLRFYLTLICGLSMPLIALLFVTAGQVIPLVLGKQWTPSVAIFRALAPAALLWPLNVASGWIMVSLGRTKRNLKWNVFATVATVASFGLGLPWGAFGVAVGYSVSRLALVVPGLQVAANTTIVSVKEIVKACAVPLLAAVGAGTLTWFTAYALLVEKPVALAFLGETVTFLLFYSVLWLVFPGGRQTLLDSYRAARPVQAQRRFSSDEEPPFPMA